MLRFAMRSAVVLSVLVLLPAVASAQAAITGVARDASGGVLPGVTVEAASPALIEKVRSVVTDATGQYRIVSLRPGIYSVTFSLPGFSTVKREGIELTGTFVATVNGDLKVGALEETITVTGETPIVDVQSAKVQTTVSKDILAAIPNSRNELKVLEMHVDLAARHHQLILVHTPHLEDKLKGTRLILDVLRSDKRIKPERVIIDHVEEHTVTLVLDRGHWAGMTLYPETKCTPARAIDILETCGNERLWMNSACDWGVSDPLAVPKTALEMKRRGHGATAIEKVVYQNPRNFLSQCAKFIRK